MSKDSTTPETRSVPTTALHLAVITFVCVTPRLIMFFRTVSPARDSFRFIEAARVLEQQPLLEAVRNINVHPLYPWSLSVARGMVSAVTGDDGPFSWLYAGQLWSIACSVWFLIAAYIVGTQLWNRHIALLGCVGLSIVPRQVTYGVDVLSDNLHAACWMSGLALVLYGWRHQRIWPMAGGSVFAGLAYWTRVEALLLPLTVFSAMGTAQLVNSWRLPWRTWFHLTMAFLVPLGLMGLTFAAAIGGISTRRTAMIVIGAKAGKAPVQSGLARPPAALPRASLEIPAQSKATATARNSDVKTNTPLTPVNLVPKPFSHPAGYERAPVWAAVLILLKEVCQETRVWLFAFALVALILRDRTKTEMPGGLAVFYALLGCAVMLVLLRVRAGYMAGRYMTPVLPLLCMYGATGVEAAVRLLLSLKRFPWEYSLSDDALMVRRKAVAVVSLVALAGFLCVGAWLTPLHRFRHGHMEAARWLNRHSNSTDLIFDPSKATSFFAHRQRWRPQKSLPDSLPVRYAVVDPSLVYRTDWLTHQTISRVNEQGVLVARFPRRPGDDRIGVYIFELPAQLSQTPKLRVQ